MNKFSLVICLVAAAAVSACSDSTSPHQLTGPGPTLRSSGSVNSGGGGTGGSDTSATSTLILWDTRTGQQLDTTTANVFP